MTTLNLILAVLLHAGSGQMPKHCKPHCEIYAQHLSEVIDQAAIEQGVSPTLILAVAWAESKLDHRARGTRGEFGPFQLLPRAKWGMATAFFCEVEPSECLLLQARAAAWLLAQNRAQCGSWRGALNAYNSGRCNGAPQYAARVIRRWQSWR